MSFDRPASLAIYSTSGYRQHFKIISVLCVFRKYIDQHSSYLSVTRSRDTNTVSEISLLQENKLFKLTQNPKEVHLIPSSQRTQIFEDISSLNLTSLNNNNDNESSNTYIIQISSQQQQKESHTTLRIQNTDDNHTKDETFNLGSHSTNQHIVILNIKKDAKQHILLDTTRNKTQFTVSTLSKLTSSFSTILLDDINFEVTRDESVRIDGWSTDRLPFFDASNGLSVEQSGMYVVPSNGFYYVTVGLKVKSPSQRYFYNFNVYNL